MTINKNSVEQINVALLDMDKKIKSAISNGISASDFKNLEASVDSIKRTLNETTAGLESGKTYNINISGNAATADKATTATTAETATNANHAETATTAEAATNATKDSAGNTITTTYATKTELVKAVPSYGTTDAGKALIVNSNGTGTEWNRLIKYHDIVCGNVTIPSSGYVEFNSYLEDNEEPISAVVYRWASNTGAFYVTAYGGNPKLFYVVGTPGVVVGELTVRIYCVDKAVLTG